MRQAAATSVGLGLPSMPVALVPGHPGVQDDVTLRNNMLQVTTDKVIENLTRGGGTGGAHAEPGPRDIVFRGGFDAVNQHFIDKEWSDGLPIVPPTMAKVEQFLRYTERSPDEVLGVALPDNRAATIWRTKPRTNRR